MMRKLIKAIRDQRGITGLETAIILIAFVVVAAVFAYTVLSAGLFSTQKSQEAVYSGLEEAQSTMELKGAVIALDGRTTADDVDQITFTMGVALDGEAIDFTDPTVSGSNDGLSLTGTSATNKVVINIRGSSWEANNIYWTKAAVGKDDSDNLLESGEKFQITLGGADGNDLEDCAGTNLDEDEEFTIEIIPPSGAPLILERTLPGVIDDVMNLN